MVAVDTNIVVRLLVNDDPEQARRAALLFATREVFVPKTVILETECVLRGVYRLEPARVIAVLRAFLSLERVLLEDEEVVFRALDSLAAGLDVADSLHLASSYRAESFVTFDFRLRATAAKHSLPPPVAVP